MIKTLLLIIASLTIVCLSAFSSANSFVWKVQQVDKDNTLYLAGTIHLLAASDYPLPFVFDKAYEASDSLIFETDLGQQETQAFQQAMLATLFYRDGNTLDKVLGAKAWQAFVDWCEQNSLPAEQFLTMKPGLAAITVSLTELMKLGINQEGVDSFYYKKGLADKKPFVGLETIEEQLGFLAGMGGEHPDKLILQTIEEVEQIPTLFPAVKAAWRSGDAKGLNDLMVKDMKRDYPEVYQSLLLDRNQVWLGKITEAIKTPEVEFILVGAAHLVGEEGLLALLKAQGYILTPVSN